MPSYEGHQISFEECPLLLGTITAGLIHSGYVELDDAGEIAQISVNNMIAGKKRQVWIKSTNPDFVMLRYSLEKHLKDDLEAVWNDVDGYSDFDANREYGTHDHRAL